MLQKDIERFEIFGVNGNFVIKDNKQLPNLLDCYQSCVRLNQQSQRIAELEEQLKNAIVPKFKVGQEVWFISMTNYVCNFIIQELQYTLCCDGRSGICYFSKDNLEEYEWNLFATREEAEQRLKELKGE